MVAEPTGCLLPGVVAGTAGLAAAEVRRSVASRDTTVGSTSRMSRDRSFERRSSKRLVSAGDDACWYVALSHGASRPAGGARYCACEMHAPRPGRSSWVAASRRYRERHIARWRRRSRRRAGSAARCREGLVIPRRAACVATCYAANRAGLGALRRAAYLWLDRPCTRWYWR